MDLKYYNVQEFKMVELDNYDVIIVGSGAGGMVAALRCHDLGLKVLMIEKHYHYGGTSASSGGGVWIPLNKGISGQDTTEKALSYLQSITDGKANNAALANYVEYAHVMTQYIGTVGVNLVSVPGYADYYSEQPNNVSGRSTMPTDMDGKLLGDEFFLMRDAYPTFNAFGRYALNMTTSTAFILRARGWFWQGLKMVTRYWLDIPWRLKTSKDSKLTMGRALVGGLRKAMIDRGIPLLLNTKLLSIDRKNNVLNGVNVEHNSSTRYIKTKAVILATGGFDQNQQMRDQYHPVKTWVVDSAAPDHGNHGDGIRIGQEIGASIDNMEHAWWCPTVRLPGPNNTTQSGQLFFDRGRPGVICINSKGKRFCNEAISYDRFGFEMIREYKEAGANTPLWMIFDARYRNNRPASNIMPAWVVPDHKLPLDMWDNILYRANTVEELAKKIGVDPQNLKSTIETVNTYAKTGKDLDFGRGDTDYDRLFGDPNVTPNPNLALLDTAPYYAIKIELGDLGTKGGLKVDEFARVLDLQDKPIVGLYATGNTTGSIFRDIYPGAGGTLGPAMTFAYVAAEHISGKNGIKNQFRSNRF